MTWPCATSNDSLVWRLWHSHAWRRLRGLLIDKGTVMGMEWANCPGCGSTICKEVKHG